jgi:hypothetical protein
MTRQILLVLIVCYSALVAPPVFAGTQQKLFNQYPVPIYSGMLHVPKKYVLREGVWRDELGKEIGRPEINFSGKYYVGLHSCGAECRYFPFGDLATGRICRRKLTL